MNSCIIIFMLIRQINAFSLYRACFVSENTRSYPDYVSSDSKAEHRSYSGSRGSVNQSVSLTQSRESVGHCVLYVLLQFVSSSGWITWISVKYY